MKIDQFNESQVDVIYRLSRYTEADLKALAKLIAMHAEIERSIERERSYRLFLTIVRNAAAWISTLGGGYLVFTDAGRALLKSLIG